MMNGYDDDDMIKLVENNNDDGNVKEPSYLHSSNDLSDFVPALLSSALAIKPDLWNTDDDDDDDDNVDTNDDDGDNEVKSSE